MQIYNKPELESLFPKVYEKEVNEIEKEWLDFIEVQKINQTLMKQEIPIGLMEKLQKDIEV
ncbi:hypothetical protein ACTWQL_07535 [Pseudalkalibacillus sp. R45]|uniref:hypothetical protein n=1 Tax=Pseudalkalibacillus sp. R45 TaxID=3457433 RepID=UPI003FCE14A4